MDNAAVVLGGLATLRGMHEDLVLGGEPFRRRDWAGAGLSRRQLDRLTATGVLREPLYGVLVDARRTDTLELRAACAGLVLPAGAAVGRRTAAWLWGVDGRSPGEHLSVPDAECVVPSGVEPVRRPGVRCFQAPLTDDEIVVVDGVPVTTPLRTALDCARYLPPFMGLGTIDAMAHQKLVVPEEMAVEIERFRGDRFVARARRLITACEPRTESFGESWLRLRCLDAGFPRPEAQVNLPDDGCPRWRLDLGFVEFKAGGEYDGEEFHSTDEQIAHDEYRREDCLRRFGWTVLGFTKSLVLGPSMQLEYALGEVLSLTPRISRRLW